MSPCLKAENNTTPVVNILLDNIIWVPDKLISYNRLISWQSKQLTSLSAEKLRSWPDNPLINYPIITQNPFDDLPQILIGELVRTSGMYLAWFKNILRWLGWLLKRKISFKQSWVPKLVLKYMAARRYGYLVNACCKGGGGGGEGGEGQNKLQVIVCTFQVSNC